MSHHKPDPNKNVSLTIDGISITVPEGTRILEAAKKANVNIPVLCEHPDLCKRALCRICVVECDGRGKLIAACANDVWEGVNIVTSNKRLFDVRKTILELILANHPQDCLSCVRNKKCELQSLAMKFGIRGSSFSRTDAPKTPEVESETLVRDMNKCVKCARCVEVCQEVQTIRAINTSGRSHDFGICAPYRQSLNESSCVFCGQCASVCPVGAIYVHDQSAQVWDSLNDSGQRVIAQASAALTAVLDSEFSLVAGTIKRGQLISAIKLLGFDRVYDAGIAANADTCEQNNELQQRIKNGGSLPMISGCSDGVYRFINRFYPDFSPNLFSGKNPRQIFKEAIKQVYADSEGLDIAKITTVSFVPDIAQKHTSGAHDKTDFVLTAEELGQMIKLAGIEIQSLPETPFDSVKIETQSPGNTASPETVSGFAKARETLEAVRRGDCKAKWIEINC